MEMNEWRGLSGELPWIFGCCVAEPGLWAWELQQGGEDLRSFLLLEQRVEICNYITTSESMGLNHCLHFFCMWVFCSAYLLPFPSDCWALLISEPAHILMRCPVMPVSSLFRYVV